MNKITIETSPWTAAGVDPFHSSWSEIDDTNTLVPKALKYVIVRFFIGIGCLIILPLFIYMQYKYRVVKSMPLITNSQTKDNISPVTLPSKFTDALNTPTKTIAASPLPNKSASKYQNQKCYDIGIPNFGTPANSNTCYMNATLQMIYRTPLREVVLEACDKITLDPQNPNALVASLLKELITSMNDNTLKEVKKAKYNFATACIASEAWQQHAELKKHGQGEMQASRDFIVFLFTYVLNITPSFGIICKRVTIERSLTDPTVEPIIQEATGTIETTPFLNIEIDNEHTIKKLIADMTSTVIVNPATENDSIKTPGPKGMAIRNKDYLFKLHEENRENLTTKTNKALDVLFEGSSNYLFNKDQLPYKQACNYLGITSHEDLLAKYASLGCLYNILLSTRLRTVGEVTLESTELNKTLIVHLSRNNDARINRKELLPEKSLSRFIEVNGLEYKLVGAIDRPDGFHYTYIRFNDDGTYTYFDDCKSIKTTDSFEWKSGLELTELIYQRQEVASMKEHPDSIMPITTPPLATSQATVAQLIPIKQKQKETKRNKKIPFIINCFNNRLRRLLFIQYWCLHE